MAKTHLTAVAIVSPEEAWEPIQQIRRSHDRKLRRWMPHINLLYPFRPRGEWDEGALREAVTGIGSFTLTLSRFDSFRHHAHSFTLWLAPEPREPLDTLQRALLSAAPECDDLNRFEHGFTPHLGVGQFRDAASLEGVRAELQLAWQPLTFRVDEICLLGRGPPPRDVFAVVERIALG